MSESLKEQSLLEHLSDLRATLIRIFIFLTLGFSICLFQTDFIISILKAPISPFLKETAGELIFTSPTDKFAVHMKVAFVSGLILTSPFWLYEVWRFVAPGLYRSEKKTTFFFLSTSLLLFLSGCSFVYFLVYPNAFSFLLSFGGGEDKAFITLSEYISFLTTTVVAFGLAFEMPLILLFMGKLGLVSKDVLKQKRRYIFVGLAILSAFITPPDVLSMALLLIPLFLLFELSILLVPSQQK